MKRNTLFGAAGLLAAGAAIGAGAIVSQNAMADDGGSAIANTVTMINIDEDGTAVQCTFTGADAEGILPAGIPTDDAAKAEVVMGSAQIAATDGSLPMIEVSGGAVAVDEGVIAGLIPVGSFPPGDLVAQGSGVITVGASTANGEVTISGISPSGDPIAGPETREGTAEECAAMHDQAVADLAQMEAIGGTISVSAEAGVTKEP